MTFPNDDQLMPPESSDDIVQPQNYSLGFVGRVANVHAAQSVFVDYLSQKSVNTV